MDDHNDLGSFAKINYVQQQERTMAQIFEKKKSLKSLKFPLIIETDSQKKLSKFANFNF